MSETLTLEEIIEEAKKVTPDISDETIKELTRLLKSELLDDLKSADITKISNELLVIQLNESHEN